MGSEDLNLSLNLNLHFICGAILFLFACNPPPENRPPNVLLIMVDDLGKEWVSAYGAEEIETPHVDQLAREGIRFQNVYAMPQCTPTRLTLLTGQYPFRHGWVNHWDVPRWGGGAHYDPALNPSLGRQMKMAGYKTAIAGKWQVSDFRVEPEVLREHGFDAYCMWTGYETGVPASAERFHDPYIHTAAGSRTYPDQFGPDVFKEFLIDFIRENKDSAMFIYYPMVLTHPPLITPPGDTATTNIEKHKAMVRYADRITGELVQALEEVGIREQTLIIWTTDNGTSRGITGRIQGREIAGGKGQTSEAGTCVPFIASWPGTVPANQVSEALIDFSDLFPTLLDLAGHPQPPPAGDMATPIGDYPPLEELVPDSIREAEGGTKHTIDGISFKEALLTGGKSQRSWIMSMGGGNQARLTAEGVENQYRYRDRVLRNERFKLFIDAEGLPEKLVDLQTDPSEEHDHLKRLEAGPMLESYNLLLQAAQRFPGQDNDPVYQPNPPQAWDVEIGAESEVWKR
jgi:hypothetical protein